MCNIATLSCNAMFTYALYIHSISTMYCTAKCNCASIPVQYSYTVRYRHVKLCLTTYTEQLYCTLTPCSSVPLHTQYIFTVLYRHVQLCLTTYTIKLHCTLPTFSAATQYIYGIASLHRSAMFSCASLHMQYSYTVLYRHVQLCLTIYTV